MGSWDAELIRRQGAGTLVQIGREGRLLRVGLSGPARVGLSWVDEAALALVEATVSAGRNLALVYPAPAGDVAVLLAAQILLHRFLRGADSPAVGVLTADPVQAARTWNQLSIAAPASREALCNVFPCWRAHPDGNSPFGGRRAQGVLIGRTCNRWPVDVTIFDHLAGPIAGWAASPVIHIFADPLDPLLDELASRGDLIWGWSDAALAVSRSALERRTNGTIPFSVGQERIETMAAGVEVAVVACRHEEAERALERLRDDLQTLSSAVGPNPSRNIEIGLKVAWAHVSTLAALPSRPSEYDRFAGLPPRAARPTGSFDREVMAWARTLGGDLAEYAGIVAEDMADLRTALDRGTPFVEAIHRYTDTSTSTLVVVRTRTAARALIAVLQRIMHAVVSGGGDIDPALEDAGALPGTPDMDRDPHAFQFENLIVTWLGALHRRGTATRAVVVGAPPKWAWHHLDSGISRQVDILVLGEKEARRARWAVATVRGARAKWASLALREKVWRELVREDPPLLPVEVPYVPPDPILVAGPDLAHEPDPFSPLGALLKEERPLPSGGEGGEQLAVEGPGGQWQAMVHAVEIETDQGYLVLPAQREVDVLVEEDEASYTASSLRPGMRIAIGRHSGRIGLLEALEEKLGHRPDLLAGRLLVQDYRNRVYKRYDASGLTVQELHSHLVARGCSKVPATVAGWVRPGGPMAPRDLPDLRRLNAVLELGLSERWINELFAAITRIRTFRRAAGKALAEAAREATRVEDESRVDPATGFSVADLREAVLVVTVKAVREMPLPVRLTETGRLEGVSRL